MSREELRSRIDRGEALVSVIGLGYVGLPLAVSLLDAGYRVIGIDSDEERVAQLKKGVSYVQDVDSGELARWIAGEAPRFRPAADFSLLREADVVIICVPTPLSKTKDPDLSFILAAVNRVKEHIHSGQLVILESTSYPGTTRELVLPILAETGLEVGRDFFLSFSPERLDPGNREFGIKNTPKVVGGVTPECTRMAVSLYSRFIDRVIAVSSAETAEMVKLLENTFRSVNIGLVNEITIMCDKLGINVWEVIEAAASKPFGFMKFTPGPGLGGHCIPVDPHYLSWKLKHLNYRARFIELAGEVNSEMPAYVLGKVVDALNEQGKCLNGARILFVGVAYKKNVSDTRESPALDIMQMARDKKANVYYHDPLVPEVELGGRELSSVPLDRAVVRDSDCVVITCDHDGVDYRLVAAEAAVIVDTRNVYGGRAPGKGRFFTL